MLSVLVCLRVTLGQSGCDRTNSEGAHREVVARVAGIVSNRDRTVAVGSVSQGIEGYCIVISSAMLSLLQLPP